MTFQASVITLYPDMFPGPLGFSLAGNALESGKWSLDTVHLRDFGRGKHANVDDTPAGGGAGMVLRADVLADAIDSLEDDTRPRLLMSPRGKPLTQKRVRELSQGEGAIIICGRFEGVDERVIEGRNLEEVSIGDYILSGGEPAALVLLDSIVRLLPGVMGNQESGERESFENGLLEHPHYTRPQEFEGQKIPDILTSGNHGKVAEWQRQEAEKLTRERRPDLLKTQPGACVDIMPAIPVNDMDEGVSFYRDKLGFECVYFDPGGTAVLTLDNVELHLWLANDESWKSVDAEQPIVSGAESFLAGTHSCRIIVNDIFALHENLKAADLTILEPKPEKKPWGTTEFSIKDPYGNLVIFFEWV